LKALLDSCLSAERQEMAETLREMAFKSETCTLKLSHEAQHELHRTLESASKPEG
jgi:hypothetical protein